MISFTCFFPCVFYLLSIAHSAEAYSLDVPRCEDELGEKAIPDHNDRYRLAGGVIAVKGQLHGPKYTCELEKLARNLVTEPAGIVGGGYEVTFDSGSGTPNMEDIANKWEDRLKNMSKKDRFGCNLSKRRNNYEVACVYI
ncbi:hypothetical protein Aduo_001441 [Ancylostoma duodenale]